jgi:hypothetical protein
MSTKPDNPDRRAFEMTQFGRRRISRVPRVLLFGWRILRGAAVWVYHKCVPARGPTP